MEYAKFLLPIFFASYAWGQTILTRGGDLSLRAGDQSNGAFTCEVEGIRRTTEVRWFRQSKEGERIRLFTNFDRVEGTDHRYSLSGMINMLITPIQLNDEGIYICQVVKNKRQPETADNSQEIIFNVKVTMAPEISFEPEGSVFHAKRGTEMAEVKCLAEGRPEPTVAWKPVRPLPEGAEWEDREGTLVLKDVSEAHAGQFVCVANNTISTVEQILTVDVLYAPKFQSAIPHKQHYNPRNDVRLMCGFTGKPQPKVTWKRGDEVIMDEGEEGRVRILEEGTESAGYRYRLLINEPQEGDIGTYTCHAENSEGSDESGPEHALIVLGIPRKPKIEDLVPYDTTVRITFSVRTHFAVDKYRAVITQKNPRNPDKGTGTSEGEITNALAPDVENSMTFTVDLVNLDPSTEYEVEMRVRNKEGWSEKSKAKDFTTAVDPNAPPTTRRTTTMGTSATTTSSAHDTEHVIPDEGKKPVTKEPPYKAVTTEDTKTEHVSGDSTVKSSSLLVAFTLALVTCWRL